MTCSDCKHAEICKHNGTISNALNQLEKAVQLEFGKKPKAADKQSEIPAMFQETKDEIREMVASLCKHFEV